MIDDLIKKCNYSIKKQLANSNQHPTNLLKLVKQCQQIEQQLKSADCLKFLQDKNAEQDAARKNNANNNNGSRSNRAIVNSPINAVPMQIKSNLNSRMQHIFQPQAQINALIAASTPIVTFSAAYNGSKPQLSEEKMEKLKKFN